MTLYQTTKQLLELTKQVTPQYEILTGRHYTGVKNINGEPDLIPDITGDALMFLIPALFKGVNPLLLSRRYFDYDENGQNWWMRSQEEVLTDLINEIKKHYKV